MDSVHSVKQGNEIRITPSVKLS